MFSIIVCSNRPERAHAIRTHYETLFRDHAHEFILVDDPPSLCEGYTRGLSQSNGDAVIFSHDDIEFITADVGARLQRHLDEFDVVGIAGTTRLIDGMWTSAGDPYCFMVVAYPEAGGLYSVRYAGKGPLCVSDIQALDGCFLACRRTVATEVGFDSRAFDGFHFYDLDFTFRAYLRGFRMAVCRDIALIHASMGHLDEKWQRYRDRFEAKHREHLSPGERSDMKVVGAMLRKEQLPRLCQPDMLIRSVKWD